MIERTFIEQGVKKIELQKYLKKELNKAGFTHLDIVKTPLVTRLVLNVARPGLAIGRGGQNIKQLTDEIGRRFKIDNPQIEIQEISEPELDATATVDRLVALIERGFSWRSIAFRTVKGVMGAGAQGVELLLSGKLAGKGGRKRKMRLAEGYMKKVGNQTSLVDYAKKSAYPKAGAIGVKLKIIRKGVVFPDKINISELLEKRKMREAEEAEAAERVREKAEGEKQGKKKEEKKAKVKEQKTCEKEPGEMKREKNLKKEKDDAKTKGEASKEKATKKKPDKGAKKGSRAGKKSGSDGE